MNEAQRKELLARVQEEITKTEATVKDLRELTRPIAPDDSIGRVSRMDAINNKSVNDAALRKAEERLAGLKRMLARADRPEFGECVRCRKEIPLGRLLLVPEATNCVNCAQR